MGSLNNNSNSTDLSKDSKNRSKKLTIEVDEDVMEGKDGDRGSVEKSKETGGGGATKEEDDGLYFLE